MNNNSVLPHEQETAPSETHLGDFLSHSGIHDEKSLHESLITQEERAAIEDLQSDIPSGGDLEDQANKFTDGQIIHEYIDYGLGYRYRRINKGKIVDNDGTEQEKEKIEVDVKIFAQDLPLEEMYMWALRVNFWIGVFVLLVPNLFLIYVSGSFSFEIGELSVWCQNMFQTLVRSFVMIGAILFQRKIYREALARKEYKEGKMQLSSFVFLPVLMVAIGFMLTMKSYYAYYENLRYLTS